MPEKTYNCVISVDWGKFETDQFTVKSPTGKIKNIPGHFIDFNKKAFTDYELNIWEDFTHKVWIAVKTHNQNEKAINWNRDITVQLTYSEMALIKKITDFRDSNKFLK